MNYRKLSLILVLAFALTLPGLALASLGDIQPVGETLGNQATEKTSGITIKPVASPDGTFGGWILANLSWLIPTLLLLLDNMVKVTPTKWIKSDDLVVTSFKAGGAAFKAGLKQLGGRTSSQ